MQTTTNNAKKTLARRWAILGILMILGFFTNPVLAQDTDNTVAGQVTSIDGPVEGATVILKGSLEFIMTDQEGRFVFPIPLREDDVLEISMLGMEDTSVVIKDDTRFVRPFLEDIPVKIIAALRTQPSEKAKQNN